MGNHAIYRNQLSKLWHNPPMSLLKIESHFDLALALLPKSSN
jgi:hypothetical protein